MVKMTNDKFDEILDKRIDEKKQYKAKKEATRQFKIDNYYDDYHKRVESEKRKLYSKNISILNVLVLLIIIIVMSCLVLSFCFPEEFHIILSYFL